MLTQDVNPDPRPLPVGWTQHFESTTQLWYYVRMNVTPAKVSFTHPIDILPPSRRPSPYCPTNNTQMPQLAVPLQTLRKPSQPDSKLTFAQQLYASSLSPSMINSQSAPPSQLPPILINLPMPPPSSSLSDGSDMPPLLYQSSSHTMNGPSSASSNFPSTAPPFPNPHRANTEIPILSNNNYPQRPRANTYDPGTSQRPANVNPSISGFRPTRHLVTMARPPDQQSLSESPLLIEPPATAHSASTFPSPLPASSILFSQTTALKLPPTPRSISPFGRVAGGSLAGGVVSALQSVLLTPGTGVDQLSLHAVVQGWPDADYQRIINALIKLHQQQQREFALMKLQMQQPPPAIDYKVLIAEVQKVQAQHIATAQQQQRAQLHTGAQLQGAQQQQQQPQTAAQQYQALVLQKYQQQEAAQQEQQQQAAQYQAFLKQQQTTALAQQNPLRNNAVRPPPLNIGGDTSSGCLARPLSDPNSLLVFARDGGGLFDNNGDGASFSRGSFRGKTHPVVLCWERDDPCA